MKKIKIDFSKFDSLLSVAEYFTTDSICKQTLAEARWGDDVVCPYCGKHHCTKMKNGRYCCTKCKHNFSCTVRKHEDFSEEVVLRYVSHFF